MRLRSPTRRGLVFGLCCCPFAGGVAISQEPAEERIGAPPHPWRPGQLDIHVLATGRGDAALIVTPNGTTLLIDVGAAGGDPAHMLAPAKLNQTAGAFIANYVHRRLRDTGGDALDVLYITHLHDDHVGGLTDFAARVPIRTLIDPDFPTYGYPPFEGRAAIERYVAFVQARAAAGGRTLNLAVGRDDQFDLEPVRIRALASRGEVWTGQGAQTRSVFPRREDLAREDYPGENAMSSAVLLSFGGFRAFFGGDLTDWAEGGARPWMDALTPATQAAGPVNFALAPHHGLYTASGAASVRALQPQIWAISAWHETHPSPSTLARLLERGLNPRLQGVFVTGLSQAAATMSARLAPRLASASGHILARVDAEGRTFQVLSVTEVSGQETITSATPRLLCSV